MEETGKHRVVILGAGFAGLGVMKRLKDKPVDVTVIDRQNHHLFQPLLYQVATAGLAATNVAYPVRAISHGQIKVEMADVEDIDYESKIVHHSMGATPYDTLVVATGSKSAWIKPHWEDHSIGLKTIDDANRIRNRVLSSFEMAEMTHDEAQREKLQTFVLVGGGPTGVELAGSISELANHVLAKDFKNIDPRKTRIILLEALDRLLLGFDESLSAHAKEDLEQLGVEVWLESFVEDISERGVQVKDGEFIESATVIWTAGVEATPAADWLNVEANKKGQIKVDSFLRVKDRPGVYALGDVAENFHGGEPLPMLASVALQQGKWLGSHLAKVAEGNKPDKPFKYQDRGIMATIGRSRAVVEAGKIKLTGLIAWLIWMGIHLFYLVGFRNRLLAFIQWVSAYYNYSRGARVITGEKDVPDDRPRPVDADEQELSKV
ncbi:MAG: NAD(P)/FAD-dependent oxidoreductase [Fimbriimonadaceae bacterium]